MLTLGTAGHIDHGKTSLVEALTGTNTDRLEEERARGISIELGYARLALGDGVVLSVVDVPGHERFVRNDGRRRMTGIDFALLVVAADDGVMPQTREHLAILAELGVARGVVALTKTDLVDAEGLELAQLDIEEALDGHPLEGAAVVPVSVRTGAGIDDLRAALRALAAGAPARRADGAVRLPIDRAFTLHGIGTIVTGTLWSGTLRAGDRCLLLPSGREARVRSLQMHDAEVAEAPAGGRVAAALVGVERDEVARGDMLVVPPAPPRSFRLDVRLHAVPGGTVVAGERVEVLHGTASARARVVLLADERLADGATGDAQLRLDRPLAALAGDRCVIRRLAPPDTVAGALVLDPAPRRHAGDAADVERLALLAAGDAEGLLAAEAGAGPVRVDDLVARGLVGAEAGAGAADALVRARRLVRLDGGLLVGAEHLRERAAAVAERLRARAAEHPLDPGVPLAELLPGAGRDALAARLEADGVLVRDQRGARAPDAVGATLGDPAADAVVAALAGAPYDPPALDEAMAAAGVPERLRRTLPLALEREGRIVRLKDGLAVARTAYDAAQGLVAEGVAARGAVTIAELRDATGVEPARRAGAPRADGRGRLHAPDRR